ncbi:MAG: LysM peptidoglycan-binding domain-containing protein, partial [Planctomycetota bacterium]
MAFYSSTSYGGWRRRTRRWMYTISTLLVIVVVIVCIYVYRSLVKHKGGTGPTGTDIKAGEGTPPDVIGLPPEPNLSKEGPVTEPDPEAAELIAKAMDCINAEPARIIEAREILNDALAILMDRQQRAVVKKQLAELANEWLFSRKFFPQDRLCESCQIRPGDQLSMIGKRYKVPWEILLDINKISRPEHLRAGDIIKVINGPFHARIYRSTFTMDLYLQDTFVRTFAVGLGMPGRETP